MGGAELAPLLVAVPLLAAAALTAVGEWLGRRVTDAVALIVTGVVAALAIDLLVASQGTHLVTRVGGWGPGAGVAIVLVSDAASAGFALLAALLVAAGLVFTWRYFDEVGAFYSALVLVFLAAVCGFVLSADLFDMSQLTARCGVGHLMKRNHERNFFPPGNVYLRLLRSCLPRQRR